MEYDQLPQRRDQAIFVERKPLNCFGQGQEALYKNVELYNIMKTLGIEDSVDDLRYEKVILATDADVEDFIYATFDHFLPSIL